MDEPAIIAELRDIIGERSVRPGRLTTPGPATPLPRVSRVLSGFSSVRFHRAVHRQLEERFGIVIQVGERHPRPLRHLRRARAVRGGQGRAA